MRQYVLLTHVPVAELDPYGELPPVAFLRLLQLAAARASDSAGLDSAWYADRGSTWIVRSTRLETETPALHDDDLVIRTWVSDIRRVRSLRQYEIARAADEVVLASASTDWVYVNAQSGAPAAVPDEVQRAIMPDGVTSTQRPRRARPAAGIDPTPLLLRRVEFADLDALGHVNNSVYASFVEQALYAKLEASGWVPALTAASPHLRTSKIEIEYMSPALYRHQVAARIAVSATSDNEIEASVEVLANDRRAAVATGCWQWSDGALPDALRSAIA